MQDDARRPLLAVPSSIVELAYDYLRAAIMSGQVEENAVLNQEEIAVQLGASRVPVREALMRLESEGLVVQRPRRGYIVTSLDPAAIEDIFDIRVVLEERAAFLAAVKRTPEQVAEVEAHLLAMDALQLQGADGYAAHREHHAAFHHVLLSASGRPHLMRAITVQRNLVERYIRIGASLRRHPELVRDEHGRILDAFRSGDAARCAAETRLHAQRSCERLLQVLRETRR